MRFRTLLCLLVSLGAAGCASSLLIEGEHVSHPGAGWPCGARNEEDSLTHVQALLRWRAAGAGRVAGYLDAGLGANVRGSDGGGFYGPGITGTVRVGMEVRLKE